MNVKSFLPILFVVGGSVLVVTQGPKAVAKAQNMVKTKLQRGELAETAKSMRLDIAEARKVPRPGHPDDLADYLRELRAAEKQKDVALDAWQRPFLLEWDQGRQAVFRSRGANGDRDACTTEDFGSDGGDDICERIDFTPPKPREAL